MDRYGLNGTIAAISTPIGRGGIGIVRLSGDKALDIAEAVFRPKNGFRAASSRSFTTHYGHIAENGGRIIDEVLLTVMRRPRTYTREDIVEINCHSGIAVLRRILDLVIESGARPAQPGEFTKRAFLNGRIDLLQAEAVLDIIASKTEASRRIAIGQLEGGLSKHIKKIRDELVDIYCHIEVSLDFPDEDIDTYNSGEIAKRLADARNKLKALLDGADKGIIMRSGFLVPIAGRANVGKSSLMNALLGTARAIVTPIAGTTRDSIEENVDISGIPFRLADTAGLIEAENDIDKEAVRRSREYLRNAEIVLLVLDGSEGLSDEDLNLAEELKDRKIMIAVNKIDLPRRLGGKEVRAVFGERPIAAVSALNGNGLPELKEALVSMVWRGDTETQGEAMLTSARHRDAVREAEAHIDSALKGITAACPSEVFSIDIKDAMDALGQVAGDIFTEDILNRIFSQFCIGK